MSSERSYVQTFGENACHPEGNEGSLRQPSQILRFPQDDRHLEIMPVSFLRLQLALFYHYMGKACPLQGLITLHSELFTLPVYPFMRAARRASVTGKTVEQTALFLTKNTLPGRYKKCTIRAVQRKVAIQKCQ